jgi:hypothetical protein
MKIIDAAFGASCLAFVVGAANVHAQNVGVGVSNPQAKLTVLGSLAVGDNSFNVSLASSGSSTNANWSRAGVARREISLARDHLPIILWYYSDRRLFSGSLRDWNEASHLARIGERCSSRSFAAAKL